jgi:hypothetical protein
VGHPTDTARAFFYAQGIVQGAAMSKHLPAAFTFGLSLAAATTLMAQAPATDVDALTRTPALHVQQAPSGVQYLSGGVGTQERDAMRALESEFPLEIQFTNRAGEYAVAQQVRVLDARGQVVAVQNAGPLVMFKLPPGHYQVQAQFGRQTQQREVDVGNGASLLRWATPGNSHD